MPTTGIADVVALTAALAADRFPASSTARTVNAYVVDGARPVTVAAVPGELATTVDRYTCTGTDTLSPEPVHDSDAACAVVLTRQARRHGRRVSVRAAVTRVGVELQPAGSAWTPELLASKPMDDAPAAMVVS